MRFPWFRKKVRASSGSIVDGIDLDLLESKIGYRFRDQNRLLEAITHPSVRCDGDVPTYERLAWVGDAFLYHALSEHLIRRFPQATTEELHEMREAKKSNPVLAKIGRDEIGIAVFIRTGPSRMDQEHSMVMVATMMEAVIGGIFMEDPKAAKKFINKYILKD